MKIAAILRGINVSGQNIIRMEELRHQLSNSGFEDVSTYIQSGNIFFSVKKVEKEKLRNKIAKCIKDNFGFDVIVIIKTKVDIQQILDNDPFIRNPEVKTSELYYSMLTEVPGQENIQKLAEVKLQDEEFVLKADVVYIRYPSGAGQSKFGNNIIEGKLKVGASARNWNTMNKILENLSK